MEEFPSNLFEIMKALINRFKSRREGVSVFVDQSIVSGVNFLIGILLARFIGLDQYGQFVLVWMIVQFVSSLQQAFIIKPLFALFPKSEDKRKYIRMLLGNQLIFAVLLFALGGLFGSLSIFVFEKVDFNLVANIVFVVPLFILHDFFRRTFFALRKSRFTIIIDVIAFGLQIPIAFGLYMMEELSMTSFLITLNVLFALGNVVAWRCLKLSPLMNGQRNLMVKHWKYSKYLLGTSILQWVSGNFFLIAAGGILGTFSVGAIRIAQNIVGVLHVLFLAMENIVPLRASEALQRGGNKRMLDYIKKITRQMGIPVLIILLIIVYFRIELIELLYGSEYIRFNSILVAFCVLYIMVYLGTILRFIIRTIECNEAIFTSYIISSIFSLVLAYPLVRAYQETGVMMGLFITQGLSLITYFLFLKTKLKWKLR